MANIFHISDEWPKSITQGQFISHIFKAWILKKTRAPVKERKKREREKKKERKKKRQTERKQKREGEKKKKKENPGEKKASHTSFFRVEDFFD